MVDVTRDIRSNSAETTKGLMAHIEVLEAEQLALLGEVQHIPQFVITIGIRRLFFALSITQVNLIMIKVVSRTSSLQNRLAEVHKHIEW